ncbi:ABC transporter ATP-binding protein [Hansschlegelia quercus]|uniref:ABC transporter ATP-binding protein n=1 Tax=Hansschlegelia quercus TaxID=2528245 RepID=A0A4Q9GJC3_9HYPH|nr:ABC transporter ATP-binding protein [Hansschlegelia quercus]TBN52558.1 ABC transporter ATP-binding protein [Hansschlegelia quercus]
MAAITLTSVTFEKARARIVDDVSLAIPDGAICVITGPTGAGKSTLLKLVAGQLPLTSGEIEIGEAARQSWRIGRDDIAELIDPTALPARGNLYDAITGGLRARGLKRKAAQEDALKGADAVGIGALMSRRIASASSGERALAAFSRAYARPPRALLLDEPFAGLPPARRTALRRELRRLQRESGVTTILATQDTEDALALGDLLAVMDAGRILSSGSAETIYDHPADIVVARLFGAPPMNLLPVRANQTGLSLEDGTNLGGTSVMTKATFAWLGVRPEDLFVLPEGSLSPGGAKFPVTVEEVERANGSFLVHGHVGPHPVVARLAERPSVEVGGRLMLGARAERLHMFDAETGARL